MFSNSPNNSQRCTYQHRCSVSRLSKLSISSTAFLNGHHRYYLRNTGFFRSNKSRHVVAGTLVSHSTEGSQTIYFLPLNTVNKVPVLRRVFMLKWSTIETLLTLTCVCRHLGQCGSLCIRSPGIDGELRPCNWVCIIVRYAQSPTVHDTCYGRGSPLFLWGSSI